MNIRKLGGEVFIYGLSNGLDAVASFVILFFLGRYLTPDELGISEIITATGALLLMVAALNMDHALTRYYYDEQDSSRRALTTTHAAFVLVTGAVALLAGVATVYGFRDMLTEHWAWFFAFLIVPIRGLGDHVAALLRLRHEPGRHFVFMTVRTLGVLAITLFALVAMGQGVKSIFVGRAAAGVLAALLLVWGLRKAYSATGSWAQLRRSVRFAAPMLGASAAYWGMVHGPKYFLQFLGSATSEVGYYGVGVRLSYILSLIGLTINMAWQPFAMGIKDSPEARDTLGRGVLYFMLANTAIVIPFAAFPQEIVRALMGPTYVVASNTVGLLMISAMLANMVLMFFVQVSIAEQTHWISWANTVGLVCVTALSIPIIPFSAGFGESGAATGTAVCTLGGELAALVFMYRAAQRSFPVTVSFLRLGGLLAVLAGVLAGALVVAQAVPEPFDPHGLLLKTGIALVAWAACFFVLGPRELRAMTRLARQVIAKRRGGGA